MEFFSSYCLAEGENMGIRDRAIYTVTLLISAQTPNSASKPKALYTSPHRPHHVKGNPFSTFYYGNYEHIQR